METAQNTLPEDLAELREMLLASRAEKQALEIEKQVLEAERQALRSANGVLEHDNRFLREQLNLLKAKRFGRSSEKSDPKQLGLFDEAELAALQASGEDSEPEGTTPVAAHRRKKKGRPPIPAWLPRVEVIHDLPESEKTCRRDGSVLVEIGREVSEQLDMIPARIQAVRHIRIKYGCPHCRTGVKTAPAPVRPFPKALATAGMLAYVAVSKYADGLPLYRQAGMLVRAGLGISRSTMAGWMIQAGQVLQPLINLMRDVLLDYGVLQMDETPVQVLKEPNKLATSKSFMWVQRGGPPKAPVILFDYDPSRSGSVPAELLFGYQGYLQTDGYAAYETVEAPEKIDLVGCWAHVRRKFDEAIKAIGKRAKVTDTLAGQAVARIRKLYRIEKELRESKASAETRHKIRQEKSAPILDDIKEWMEKALPTVPPKSTLGKALGYMAGQWPKLIRYIEDGRLEVDNNLVENAIRPFVIGRKGWLFSNSVRGVKASANLYSIIETAKANGLEPFAYLKHIFTLLPSAETVEDYEALLPWKINKAVLSMG